MRNLLKKFLLKIAEICLELSNKLALKRVEDFTKTYKEVGEYKAPPAPHSFTTFKEGMASIDYCTRHDAASKLVGYYLYQNGHPLVEELIRAAEILTEDTLADKADVSYLVGAWKDQASATSDIDREAAEEREDKIYQDLKYRAQKALEVQVKLAESDKQQ